MISLPCLQQSDRTRKHMFPKAHVSHDIPLTEILRSAFCVRRSAFCIRRSAFCIWRSGFCVRGSAFSVRHCAFCTWRSAFCLLRSAFGVLQLAFGVLPSTFGVRQITPAAVGVHIRVRFRKKFAVFENLNDAAIISMPMFATC